jgi:hypothetical protein
LGHPVERAVRPDGVVVDAPGLDGRLRIGEIHKPVLVQTLVAKLAVEALDVLSDFQPAEVSDFGPALTPYPVVQLPLA